MPVGFLGYMMAITGPAELSAAATLIDFWQPNVSSAVWYTIFIVLIVIMSFFGVRVYGEVRDPIIPNGY
jgi:yeast amino acid transporter